jgi:nitrite reductase/ring-hydroxylating ferredoxin subunit
MASVPVADSAQVPLGAQLRCGVGGVPVMLVRLEEGLFAVHDTCVHRGASLSDSPMEGPIVTCHLHFWSFDVRNGANLQVPGLDLKTFAVAEREGRIYVEAPDA